MLESCDSFELCRLKATLKVFESEHNRGNLFVQIFVTTVGWLFLFPPQVKRRVIISNNDGIYELPHELPNNLRLRNLGNQEISGKSYNFIELYSSAQSSSQK